MLNKGTACWYGLSYVTYFSWECYYVTFALLLHVEHAPCNLPEILHKFVYELIEQRVHEPEIV